MTTQSRRSISTRAGSESDRKWQPQIHPPSGSTAPGFTGTFTPTASGFTSVEVGDAEPDAPLVVLLHGFADFWWSWRHQLTALSEQGFRVVAMDLRGYGDSDKPPRGYDGWTLAGDVAGLIRAMGYGKATLIGHADGGLVCWATALLHPRLVRSIALISSPHPMALKKAVVRDPYQRRALLPSFLAYQVPLRPERRLTADNGAEVERLVRSRSGPTWPQQPEFADVMTKMRAAIRIPGVAHSTLEYHALGLPQPAPPRGPTFHAFDGSGSSHSDRPDSRRTRPVRAHPYRASRQALGSRRENCAPLPESVITRIRKPPSASNRELGGLPPYGEVTATGCTRPSVRASMPRQPRSTGARLPAR